MNATLRTIDLTTHILSPVILGQIITYGSQLYGIIFIAMWNLISAFVEYHILTLIYSAIPELAQKPIDSTSSSQTFWSKVRENCRGWRMYFRHPVRFSGLAFALLFMTVMGFDSITLGKKLS
jgi:iron-regulated transporter 1